MPKNLNGGQCVDTLLDDVGGLTAGMAVMKGSATGRVKAPTGAGVVPVGVISALSRSPSQAGDPVSVVRNGPAVGIAGGTVASGDKLKIGDTSGRLIATTTAADEVIGEAMDDGATADEIGIIVCKSKY